MSDFDNEEYETFDFVAARADRQGPVAQAVDQQPEPDDVEDDEDDDEDDLEDASDDEIDFVIAAYREDGQAIAQGLNPDLANDLEELVDQLRRLPGDAGAIGFVSLVEEVFVICRVRGRHVQVLLSDGGAAGEWPIARDVADYLGVDIPEDEDDADPMGDLGLLADLGVGEFDLETILDNDDLGSDQMLIEVAERLKIGDEFRRVAEALLGS